MIVSDSVSAYAAHANTKLVANLLHTCVCEDGITRDVKDVNSLNPSSVYSKCSMCGVLYVRQHT